MDPLARNYFEVSFELMFRKAKGDAFQVLFGRIMNMAHPGDFVQTRPWGKLGDEKCDGYLCSQRKFFQCYAPNELKKNETLAKLEEDFSGALPHAADFFDTWVFTHNAENGRLPTWLVKEVERLRALHPQVGFEFFGFEELRKILFDLPENDLLVLLGPPVTQRALLSLGFADLQPILVHLGRQAPPQDEDPHPVPAEKLEYNSLGPNVEALLKAGMTKAGLVRRYVARTVNKELGMRVATAFRHKYGELKQLPLDSVEIFDGLRRFAVGPYGTDSTADVAALAVLAYLFEECDIFENPEAAK